MELIDWAPVNQATDIVTVEWHPTLTQTFLKCCGSSRQKHNH